MVDTDPAVWIRAMSFNRGTVEGLFGLVSSPAQVVAHIQRNLGRITARSRTPAK
jgi:hypothetical protein